MERFTRLLTRFIAWVTRHWLALVNAVLALILGLAFLAPWLMLHDHTGAGQLLYLAFRPLCHQLPERSFFLGGPRPWYSLENLSENLGLPPDSVLPRYVGNLELGYKVAFCERDTAIYAGWLLGGLVFGLLRRRLKPLPWQVLVLFAILPMALDGGIQLLGVLESDWFRRSLTGLLFGIGTIWFTFPFLESGMNDAHAVALRDLEESRAGDR